MIWEALVNLLKVKSFVTILLAFTFCNLALKGVITGDQFIVIFTMVMGFYFGTQNAKNSTEGDVIIEPYDTTSFDPKEGESDGREDV